MLKRLSLIALIVSAGWAMSGCRAAAPALETLSGRDCQGCGDFGDKNKSIVANWARDARKSEQCLDHLLFNYDVNDPYRGDCFVGY